MASKLTRRSDREYEGSIEHIEEENGATESFQEDSATNPLLEVKFLGQGAKSGDGSSSACLPCLIRQEAGKRP